MEEIELKVKHKGKSMTIKVNAEAFMYDDTKYHVAPLIDTDGKIKKEYCVVYDGLKIPLTNAKSMEKSIKKFKDKMIKDLDFCMKVRGSIHSLLWEEEL